jgi:hypothetical protein
MIAFFTREPRHSYWFFGATAAALGQRVSALRRSQPAGSTTSCGREARFTVAEDAGRGDTIQ